MDLNVICFLWYGDRWSGNDMGVEYVNRLYRGVQRNLTTPHRFICLTNIPKEGFESGVEILKLDSPSWKGCLPKICMFDPALGLKGQVFSLDIDVVITGSLDEMCSYRGDFCARSKFMPGMEHKLDGDVVGFRVGFGVDSIWKPFVDNPQEVERLTGGRERYWYRHCMDEVDRWQRLYPGQLVSYKRHVRKDSGVLINARIVSCHGTPRPHQIKDNWIKEYWI